MGLFGGNRIKDGVAGEGRVVEMGPTAKAARQTGKLDVEYEFALEVTVPGQTPYPLRLTDKVPHAKTPLLGDRLPLTVSAGEPARVRIEWDRAPDLAARAQASAAAAKQGDAAGAAAALGFTLRDEPPQG